LKALLYHEAMAAILKFLQQSISRLAIGGGVFLSVASCESPIDPPISNYKSETVRTQAARSQVKQEAGQIDAELYYYAFKSYRSTLLITDGARSEALFANDVEGVDVDTVMVFNTPLTRGNVPGWYGSDDQRQYDTSPLMTWTVEGYDGGHIRDTSANVRELLILSQNVGDTIDQQAGLTVKYDGADGGELKVYLSFDYSHTYAWGDTAVANDSASGGYLEKVIPDTGSIVFTPNELKEFTANTYLSLSISHWVYHITSASNGRRVSIERSNGASMPLYLKP
jgi:hypothetical protein